VQFQTCDIHFFLATGRHVIFHLQSVRIQDFAAPLFVEKIVIIARVHSIVPGDDLRRARGRESVHVVNINHGARGARR